MGRKKAPDYPYDPELSYFDIVDNPEFVAVQKALKVRKKVLDKDLIYELAKIHCTEAEIARICKISINDLRDKGYDALEDGRAEGKCSLRRLQWLKAQEGNVVMLVWLGKQILGQKDRQPDEATQVHFNVQMNEVPIDRKEAIEAAKKALESKDDKAREV